ncbi:Ribosome biogenesis regulatory protein-like protein [Acropora cervicornis]|uniref:Ribosome biogenesis regulatory protein n=1 Tax=Acropora cervicornis TaxID=6130 RepID=A0AAD9V1A9_ACRCE|nr:Ribosome biogenesis regulatory protein-like protein [Acropora cervicornis]
MAPVDVAALLTTAEKGAKDKLKSTHVAKEVDPELDLGNLLGSDLQPIDVREFMKDREAFLKNLARDNTQLLFNAIWKLPTERCEGLVLATLPESRTVIPREKPVPKPKPPTKWEEFAKRKGIKNRKRERLVLDKNTQEWKPRYGYKRANDDTKDWLLEVPANADPYEDQFAKKIEAKKERVAKNEYQRLRNIARNKKIAMPDKLLAPTATRPSKEQVSVKLNLSRVSTASVGKFTEMLPKEKLPKKTGKKRKFEPVVGDLSGERSRNLELAMKIARKEPLDITKALNQHIAETEKSASEANKMGAGKGRKSKGKGNSGKAGRSVGKKKKGKRN